MASIVGGSAHNAVTQGAANPSAPTAMVVSLTDGEGNLLSAGVTTLVAVQPGAQAPSNAGMSFSTIAAAYLAVDINVTALTGGTTPSVQFFIDRLAADGLWYQVWASQTVGSPATSSFDLGPGFPSAGPPNGTQHAVFTSTARFRWTSTGSPTSVTFSASVIGR